MFLFNVYFSVISKFNHFQRSEQIISFLPLFLLLEKSIYAFF